MAVTKAAQEQSWKDTEQKIRLAQIMIGSSVLCGALGFSYYLPIILPNAMSQEHSSDIR